MSYSQWKNNVEAELSRAKEARESGNEGQARVCARRAAGTIIREYFDRQGTDTQGMSAYDLIQTLQDQPEISVESREILSHLVQRVAPGGVLSGGIDLIADANKLSQALHLE